MSPSLLVVAGEASGDRAAAAVVRTLRQSLPVRVLGIGGPALAAAGASLIADLRDFTAMGLGAVATRAASILGARVRLARATRREGVTAALLVNYSDFNARLAPALHARGIHVLWYGAPQIWAWRRGRGASLRPHVDRMAVILPFETQLWNDLGVAATYVGHPAQEADFVGRDEARRRLGLTRLAETIAVLPGSRPHEVDALLDPMLAAVRRVRDDRASVDARVLIAPSLDRGTRERVRQRAAAERVATFDVHPSRGAGEVLRAFDVALTASGTATLEAALARAVPVVAYRVGPLSEAIARALVRTPHYALPNLLLDRRAFSELLQRDVTAPVVAAALTRALDNLPELRRECDAVETALGRGRTPSREVAAMLTPWLSPHAVAR